MWYRGSRKTVPSSRYGEALTIIEATGWTWQEYNDQPWDLVTEMAIRMSKRALAEKQR